ncbi:Acetylxylan esterase precursor [Rubripirellula tenax]|uniref:Acetylxylan esterase n=1 Tax=Rubripirellula tenax TaxID=2528015 RepID=A0A5C6EQP0_9BACT|nr:alpha/beta hydrolase [Rubripirellula tenax]TWU50600.1 Acetylxylan esterase precursor [Rubripirellula tenax]
MKTKLLLIALISFVSQRAIADDFAPDREITYKTIGGVELKLHVFEPEGHQASDKTPAIVFFFGGGWSSGTPRQFFQQARTLADEGMVAFSAEYRVKKRNKTTPFESVKDAKSAVRWIRIHAAELGIDPQRIAASGGSAGGHVAACTGLIEGEEEEGEDLTVSSVPNAMLLFNAVLDTTDKGFGRSRIGADRDTDISPCHHVRPGIVPTLVLHGTKDRTVPFENAERFTRLMKAAGNQCQLEAFENQEHGFFNSTFFRPKIKDTSVYEQGMQKCCAFLTTLGYLNGTMKTTRAEP